MKLEIDVTYTEGLQIDVACTTVGWDVTIYLLCANNGELDVSIWLV